jgi:hypothetical protein
MEGCTAAKRLKVGKFNFLNRFGGRTPDKEINSNRARQIAPSAAMQPDRPSAALFARGRAA